MTEPKYTNHLIKETSPYLLQHAHNPVDWYAWSPEAHAKARSENKPILLSIGYSACHWCHVMEHESFENEDIANLMNEHFVNIKVDREERPDLDQIYMSAVQLMTGHGGWPMTVFLTPEGVPFYGGTYFPPSDRHGMPGFPRVLIGAAQAFREKPNEVSLQATAMLGELRRMSVPNHTEGVLSTDLLDFAYAGIIRTYDRRSGGFGSAPKFPPTMTLEFLLRTYHRTANAEALRIVEHTCRRMAEGGMYDQLGGGFHRYSTDAKWLVPHFEKMLYDNALLSRLYLHVFQVTHDEFYSRIATETLDYIAREMTDVQGGFYSSQDADTEGDEGLFFLWDIEEIRDVLGGKDAELFCAFFGVTEGGNFESRNILHVDRPMREVADAAGISPEKLSIILDESKRKLFSRRELRPRPARDEKILTAWNGLMLVGFTEASVVLNRPDYLEIATKTAHFLLKHLRSGQLLLRTYKNGKGKLNGYLEDYAFLADGLLLLYQVSGQTSWLDEARDLVDAMGVEFWDHANDGFFYTGKSHEELIVRSKDYYDNATPSGNSVAAHALLTLGHLTGNNDDIQRAAATLRRMVDPIGQYPSAFGRALEALDFYLASPKEIAIIGARESSATQRLIDEVWNVYLPNKVVALGGGEDLPTTERSPILRDRGMIDGQPTAYVCEHYTCGTPATTAAELNDQLQVAASSGD